MKRSTFDDDKPLPPHGDMASGNRLPCRHCRTATFVATLSQYGGLCFTCYEAYCGEIQVSPTRHHTLAEKREILQALRDWANQPKDPRAWIQRLLDRHARGEDLSPMQRHALEQVGALPTSRARAFADEVQP